jgi:hypothetical protein
MENNRKFYWLYVVVITIWVINMAVKAINPYYFNLISTGLLVVITALFGLKTGINRVALVILAALNLLLIVAMIFIVWN